MTARIGAAAVAVVVGLLAACDAAAPTTSTATAPQASSAPEDPNTPLDWFTGLSESASAPAESVVTSALDGVCGDPARPLPGFAAYAGDTHPLWMGGLYGAGLRHAYGSEWSKPARLGDYQLAACYTVTTSPAPSCGTNQRLDGVTGEVTRTKETIDVRVLETRTAHQVGESSFSDVADCPGPGMVMVAGPPPWNLPGVVSVETMRPFLAGLAAPSASGGAVVTGVLALAGGVTVIAFVVWLLARQRRPRARP